MKQPAICPLCVKENGYLRAEWDLCLVTTCTRHKTLLIDTCPDCDRKLSWNRAGVGTCKCGYNLTQAPTTKASTTEGKYLESTLSDRDIKQIRRINDYFDTLCDYYRVSRKNTLRHELMDLAIQGVRVPHLLTTALSAHITNDNTSRRFLHPRIRLMPFLASHSSEIRKTGQATLKRIGGWNPPHPKTDNTKIVLTTTHEASKALGLGMIKTHDLIQAGLIEKSGSTKMHLRYKVTIRSLNNLLIQLEHRESNNGTYLSVERFIRQSGNRLTVPEVIQKVIDGDLRSGGFSLSDGLSSLHVCTPSSL